MANVDVHSSLVKAAEALVRAGDEMKKAYGFGGDIDSVRLPVARAGGELTAAGKALHAAAEDLKATLERTH